MIFTYLIGCLYKVVGNYQKICPIFELLRANHFQFQICNQIFCNRFFRLHNNQAIICQQPTVYYIHQRALAEVVLIWRIKENYIKLVVKYWKIWQKCILREAIELRFLQDIFYILHLLFLLLLSLWTRWRDFCRNSKIDFIDII